MKGEGRREGSKVDSRDGREKEEGNGRRGVKLTRRMEERRKRKKE
jgi:hypothetical protein